MSETLERRLEREEREAREEEEMAREERHAREEAEPGMRGPGRAARQRPVALLGGAALAGFAVGRLAKAGRRQRAERR